MVFQRPDPTVGQTVYFRDPENPQVQYKGTVTFLNPFTVAIWPQANMEPDIDSLPAHYILAGMLTKDQVQAIPFLGDCHITDYEQALRAVGVDPGTWEPVQASPPETEPPQQQQQPAPAGSSPLPMCNQQATDKPAEPPRAPFTIGQVVEVAPTQDQFWATLIGKKATVMACDGEICSVQIEGLPYPDVKVTRFRPCDEATVPEAPVPDQAKEMVAMIEDAKGKWLGKTIHIQDSTIESTYRGKAVDIGPDGILLEGFQSPVAWTRIGKITGMDQEPIPGDEKDAKRVHQAKADTDAGVDDVLAQIDTILTGEKVTEKEAIGKRDYRKLMDRWALLKEKIVSFDPTTMETSSGGGDASQDVTEAAKEAYTKGWDEACAEVRRELDRMTSY